MAVLIQKPSALSNTYFDFYNGAILNLNPFIQITDSNLIAVSDYVSYTKGIDYRIIQENSINYPSGFLIDQFGEPKANSYSYSQNFQGSNLNDSIFSVSFRRKVTNVGRQTDRIIYQRISSDNGINNVNDPSIFSPADAITYKVGNAYGTREFTYLTLQRAISVTQRLDPTTLALVSNLGNLSNTSGSVGQLFALSKQLNRGDEKGSRWEIYKIIPGGNGDALVAVPGADYEITSGDLNSDVIILRFLSNSVNYQIRNISEGHTFNSNPYENFPLDTQTNTQISVHNFNLAVAQDDFEITIPQIQPGITIPSNVLIDDDPLTTYQNQPIVVQANVLVNTGVWKRKIVGQPDVILSKTENEWKEQIQQSCNIFLEIKEKSTGNIIYTKDGLGPYTVTISGINNYVFQFKTTLK